MKVSFSVLGEPKAKQRPRFNMKSGMTYTPKQTVSYENLVRLEYEQQCDRYKFPDDAMLKMYIRAFYGIPKSAPKKKVYGMEMGFIRPIKKPDTDNIAKSVADSLNQIAYKDDSQIVVLFVEKFYAHNPRVEVEIVSIDPISGKTD